MSKTRSRYPVPANAEDKRAPGNTKRARRSRDVRDELAGESNRLYREDFLPPASWHNDA